MAPAQSYNTTTSRRTQAGKRAAPSSGWGRTRAALEFTFVPWLVFVLVLLCYSTFQGSAAAFVWVPPTLMGVSLIVAALLVILGDSTQREKMFRFMIVVVCGMAVVAGVLLGNFIYSNFWLEYWRLDNGARYLNVIPSEPALGHLDASMLSFAPGSKVASGAAYGYTDGYAGGTVFCVAPVFDYASSITTRVQYWAVGKNCCDGRGMFRCNAGKEDVLGATTEAANGGIILPTAYPDAKIYRKAAEAAAQQYNLVDAKGSLLVKWVADPTKYQANMGKQGLAWTVSACGAYFLFSIVIGCSVSTVLPPK